MDLRILGSPPTSTDVLAALDAAAGALDQTICYAVDGRFHFTLGEGWSIALSSEFGHRIRVERCWRSTPTDMLLCLIEDHRRLARLVVSLRDQVAEPA